MTDQEDRIRARAHQLWLEEGQPDGRAQEHWEAAARLVAMGADVAPAADAKDQLGVVAPDGSVQAEGTQATPASATKPVEPASLRSAL